MNSFLWLSLVIILCVIEVISANLVTIWFIVSAIISLLLSFVIESQMLLFALFVIVGLLLLITTKPILNKYVVIKKTPTNLDKIIGTIGITTETIRPNEIGEVKVDGKRWSAISEEIIEEGTKIKIMNIKGVKLTVRKED